MVERLIETPGATFALGRVGEAARDAARAGCAQLLEELAPAGRHGELRTSRSHSGPWIAVGLSRDFAIGVDIEVARSLPRRQQIADWLGLGSSGEASFWAHWTLRESLAKCTGGSVLVRNVEETSLAAAADTFGTWVEAGDFVAQCGCLGGNIYYSLVLRRPATDEARHCA